MTNQLSTRPPGPFRALAQRVTAHPKVEWLLTRYPVRRWRAIRRWPPVVILGVFNSFTADTWPADVYGLIAGVSAWSAVLALGRALARGPRRRLFWVYPPGGGAEARGR